MPKQLKLTFMRIRKISAIAASLYFVMLGASCSGPVKEQASCKNGDTINPNGASELALLMREMAKHVTTNHDLLLSGKPIVLAPEGIGKLKTAEKTDKNLDTALFNSLADVYLGKLKELQEAPDSLKITAHNNLVTSCKDCHSNFCPGPIKLINKMFITQ